MSVPPKSAEGKAEKREKKKAKRQRRDLSLFLSFSFLSVGHFFVVFPWEEEEVGDSIGRRRAREGELEKEGTREEGGEEEDFY